MPGELEVSQNLGDRKVNVIRATTFFGPDFNVHPEESWWHQVIDHAPEESRRRTNAGELLEFGVYEGNHLILDIKPGRVDWRLSALPGPPEETPDPLPTIGTLDEIIVPFSKVTQKWLEICPPATRIAFGTVLLMPVADRESGYVAMAKSLPKLGIEPANSFDFNYQINRPRISLSGIDGLKLNRVSKWSVLATFLLQVGSGGGAHVRDARELRYSTRLELDLSTDSDFPREFSRDEMNLVFKELVTLGREIAEKGDIP